MHPVYINVNNVHPDAVDRLAKMDRTIIWVEGNPHLIVKDDIKTLRDEFAIALLSSGIVDVKNAFHIADKALLERSKKDDRKNADALYTIHIGKGGDCHEEVL